jgi:hypothetical protein
MAIDEIATPPLVLFVSVTFFAALVVPKARLAKVIEAADESLKWLSKSIDDREFTATEVTHDLTISSLHSLPEFQLIIRQFNLPYQTSK